MNFRNGLEPILCACICVTTGAMSTFDVDSNADVTAGIFRITPDPGYKEQEEVKEIARCKVLAATELRRPTKSQQI